MNKSDLIDAMAADAGISKAAAKAALDSVTSNITKTLKGGGRSLLIRFFQAIALNIGNFLTIKKLS